MASADSRLKGAVNLGTLSATPANRANNIGQSDLDDLYRFSLSQRSSFNAALSSLAKGTNADIELYILKRSLSDTIRRIGNFDFRKLGKKLNTCLQRVGASKRGSNRNESISITGLEAGVYFLRVLQRKGNSRYVLQAAATPEVSQILSSVDTIAPTATLNARSLSNRGGTTYSFTVTYSDNVAINAASLDNSDVLITGPNDFSRLANLLAVANNGNGSPYTVTYQITAPGGTWDSFDNGTYSLALQPNQVTDSSNNAATSRTLGSFQVHISTAPPRRIKASGSSSPPGIDIDGATELAFLVEDWNKDENIGSFSNAVPKIVLRFRQEVNQPIAELTLTNGSIQASDLQESDIQELNNLLAQEEVIGSKILNSSDLDRTEIVNGKEVVFNYGRDNAGGVKGIKYEIRFLNQPETRIILFIPLPNTEATTRLTYINSLTELGNLSRIQAVVIGRNPLTNNLVSEVYGIGRQSLVLQEDENWSDDNLF